MFDRDVHHYRTHRTLNDAFGPYSKLHVAPRQSKLAAWAWAIGYGLIVALMWYAIVLWKC